MLHVIKQIQRRWPAHAPRIICGLLLTKDAPDHEPAVPRVAA